MGTTGRQIKGIVPATAAQGKSFFTAISCHINNHFAKKRGIGKKLSLTIRAVKLEEHVDLVAGDFNGAAWRRPCGNDPSLIRICRCHLVPGAVPGEWADVCGGLKPLDSHEKWKARLRGAFSIPHSTLA